MSSESKLHQERLELEPEIKKQLDACLSGIGHQAEDLSGTTFKPVDHYHRNCFYVTLPDPKESRPKYVCKLLDPKKGWDVREDMVRREHNVGVYVAGIVPELKPRLFSGWCGATDNNPALVLYSYLGEAATYIEDSEQTLQILSELLPLLVNLHTRTVSSYFGKSLSEDERARETHLAGIGSEITKFVMNDIKRDNLDPSGNIFTAINDIWTPILDRESLFALTHKDVTLSNIITKDGQPVSLIDWTYSQWEDPAHDLAYLAFWCVKRGKGEDIRRLLNESMERYHKVGLHPEKTLSFFLALKCIEYGRFKGEPWLTIGKNLLEIYDMNDAISKMIDSIFS